MKLRQLGFYAFLLILLFASCKKDEAGSPEELNCTQIDATWGGAVETIIETKCAIPSCHVAGGFGDGIFTDYNGVKAKVDNGSFEKRVLLNHNMPPVSQTPLDATTLDKLQCWFNAGALEN